MTPRSDAQAAVLADEEHLDDRVHALVAAQVVGQLKGHEVAEPDETASGPNG